MPRSQPSPAEEYSSLHHQDAAGVYWSQIVLLMADGCIQLSPVLVGSSKISVHFDVSVLKNVCVYLVFWLIF